jgi:dTDP-4-dehydrorhamnose 3,5-epimerase
MSSRFDFIETPLACLYTVRRKYSRDERGFFARLFCAEEFREIGLNSSLAQINHTFTRSRGSVRGLHFQHPPHAETKVVTCIRGEILDVAVDIRKDSPTFLQWHKEVLSPENQTSLCIPGGFAHGFQTLTDDCELLYLHTASYEPDAEGALNVQDPALSIDWPVEISEMSERDRNHPMLDRNFAGIVFP